MDCLLTAGFFAREGILQARQEQESDQHIAFRCPLIGWLEHYVFGLVSGHCEVSGHAERRLAAKAFYPRIISNQAAPYAIQVQLIKVAKRLILWITIGIQAHIGGSNRSCRKRQKARRQYPLIHRYGFLAFAAAASLLAAPSLVRSRMLFVRFDFAGLFDEGFGLFCVVG
jgi:hypothetical protein